MESTVQCGFADDAKIDLCMRGHYSLKFLCTFSFKMSHRKKKHIYFSLYSFLFSFSSILFDTHYYLLSLILVTRIEDLQEQRYAYIVCLGL